MNGRQEITRSDRRWPWMGFNVGLTAYLVLLAIILAACSSSTGISSRCKETVNVEWDPWAYLNWRTSTISRFSSITHALPCSAYVASAPTSTPVSEALQRCSSAEKEQYYEVIGKYDQYISGWSDVRDRDGNPVQPTEVDSAENYMSQLRLQYERCRD